MTRTDACLKSIGSGRLVFVDTDEAEIGFATFDFEQRITAYPNKGCVVENYVPTFVIDTKYNLARQFIGMAQASMSSHPGWERHGQPLRREANVATEQKNRGIICDRTFTADPSTPKSSQRDEYPFAESKNSGAQQGVTSGSQCQQYMVVSQTIEGKQYPFLTWSAYSQGKMRPAPAKCARAGMTKADN
ncbi:hypothetical protein [Streptomyces sp. NPDC001507]|uniref:hypothetical protein n=1 Tax=Streptomyces sp. NPDC001507 TaxID=3364579 RepID=UPI0036B641C9